jgi:hypothetical protein
VRQGSAGFSTDRGVPLRIAPGVFQLRSESYVVFDPDVEAVLCQPPSRKPSSSRSTPSITSRRAIPAGGPQKRLAASEKLNQLVRGDSELFSDETRLHQLHEAKTLTRDLFVIGALSYAALRLSLVIAAILRSLVPETTGSIRVRLFQVGDRVTLDGFYGEIRHIGLRSVRLVTLDDTQVTISQQIHDSYFAVRFRSKAYVIDVRFEKAFETDVTERVLEGFRGAGVEPPAVLHHSC